MSLAVEKWTRGIQGKFMGRGFHNTENKEIGISEQVARPGDLIHMEVLLIYQKEAQWWVEFSTTTVVRPQSGTL